MDRKSTVAEMPSSPGGLRRINLAGAGRLQCLQGTTRNQGNRSRGTGGSNRSVGPTRGIGAGRQRDLRSRAPGHGTRSPYPLIAATGSTVTSRSDFPSQQSSACQELDGRLPEGGAVVRTVPAGTGSCREGRQRHMVSRTWSARRADPPLHHVLAPLRAARSSTARCPRRGIASRVSRAIAADIFTRLDAGQAFCGD